MKWIQHDTDANQDAKLQNVLLDYGLEGYGLYWYCIELIAGKIDKNNITFELEHDARIIARNTGSTPQKTEEMMRYFVKEGLFESSEGVITCFKLARRLNQSMTSNPEMRSIIDGFKNHDGIMTKSDKVMQDKIRLDKNREDNKPLVKPEVKRSKYKFNEFDIENAKWMSGLIDTLNPKRKQPNFESWADDIRKMREIDGICITEIQRVFAWANKDPFWCSNILSPSKLRSKFDDLVIKSQGQTNKLAIDTSQITYESGSL